MKVRVRWTKEIDRQALMQRREAALRQLAIKVAVETEPYVPLRSGDLRARGIGTFVEDKSIIYGSTAVPYAARQYYEFPHKHFPGTSMKWFEVSKAQNLPGWIEHFKQLSQKGA